MPRNDDPPRDSTPAPDASRAADTRQFPCEACGARMTYQPGTRHLKCPYCGHENDIPPDPADAAEDAARELDFNTYAALADARPAGDRDGQFDAAVVHCRGCGADVTLPPDTAADHCPYCGRSVVSADAVKENIRVQALLPFLVKRDAAEHAWRAWLAGLWFAPSKLKRLANRTGQLSGLYLPYWTFDSDTRSPYVGERGEYYYVTVSYTVMVNGKPQRRTRQERRTRWYPASGVTERFFDDVLVPASGLWSEGTLDALAPWDLAKLEAYRPDFLSGFRAEKFNVGLVDGFSRAKTRMDPVIRGDVARAIGGDTQRIHRIDTAHRGVTFKHVMLPLWTSGYRFHGTLYHFHVNGRTGKVVGERPWSVWKIGGLVLLGLGLIGAALKWSGALDGF